MKQITIKDTPANATNYELEDGRIFRLYTKVLTPEHEAPTALMLSVQTNGYQINKSGDFIVDEQGEPVTLDKKITQVSLESVRAGQDTMNGGWIATDLSYDPAHPREDVKDVKQLKTLPKTGEPGDRVYAKDDKTTYVYSAGQYENIRQRRLGELVVRVPVAARDPLDLKDVLPQ